MKTFYFLQIIAKVKLSFEIAKKNGKKFINVLHLSNLRYCRRHFVRLWNRRC